MHRIWMIINHELNHYVSRPLYLLTMLVAPIFVCFFFLSLMDEGAPDDMPIAMVDQDCSKTSRNLARTLNTFKGTHITLQAKDFAEARRAVQRREVYGIFVIPENFECDIMASRQPKLTFYTNGAYFIPSSLQMSDMTTMCVLAAGAASRSVLLAKGATDEQAQALLQPIVVDRHTLSNHSTNYPVYLCTTIMPAIYNILIMLLTVYLLGMEVKNGHSRTLLEMSNGNILLALVAKLLPSTIIFTLVLMGMNSVMYHYLGFPCENGILRMHITSLLLVLASQSLSIFFYGLLPIMRIALSLASFWGVMSITMSGFTFPTSAFPNVMKIWPNLFPMRHHFLIYNDQALNGYDLYYSMPHIAALLAFTLLPMLVMGRIQRVYEEMRYEL